MSSAQINTLFDAAKSGCAQSEEQLFSLLLERFRLIAHHRLWDSTDAEEVTQEALFVIIREYRELTVTVSFAAWAQKVLDNRILARIAGNRTRETRRARATDQSEPVFESDLDLEVSLSECLAKIGRINRDYARVLNYHCQGFETDEICKRLKVKRNTLYSLLHRGRALLRRCLETGEVT
jgi:RNA polymerase sigma factor (sigma-70 family)